MSTANVTEVTAAFQKVMTGLNDDVERLGDLAAIRSSLMPPSAVSESSENSDPNARNAGAPINPVKAQLLQIESAIKSMEERVDTLTMVVEDEKLAEANLKKTRDEAAAMQQMLKEAVKNLPKKLPGDVNASGAAAPFSPASIGAASLPSQLSPSESSTASSVRTLENPPAISLVTEKELSSLDRSARGRVTIGALNDAVSSINACLLEKYQQLSQASKGKKTKKFQQFVVDHRETVTEEHEGRPFVSEQHLRDSCAFFRSGESTAKSILGILRNLKKIKQIQGKGGRVTYCVL
ncbi:hypothetical protein TrST_g3100 [Triparma strigata]|uniref:Spindle and kinetochore-associated protein 1 n=1 Tax=Triparma strigata TaxID=1606541 RepID=A0A9W7BK91_9STRA|nr:hypothetical protein TrST_g3100 [Triparma strigata]